MGHFQNLRGALATVLMAAAVAACGNGQGSDVAAPIPRSPIDRCVTLANAMEAGPVPGTWTQAVTQTDFQSIASAGFDTVRITVPLSDFTGEAAPFAVQGDALDRLETVADWALGANLTLIVALEEYDSLATSFDAQKGRLNRIWLQVAERFRDLPGSVMFDLIDSPDAAIDPAQLHGLNTVIAGQLRAAGSRHWLIMPSGNANALGTLEKVQAAADRRTIFKFDYDTPIDFTRPGTDAAATAEWGTMEEFRTVLSDMERADTVRERTRQPVMVGAFSVDGAVPVIMRARWVRAVRQMAEKERMGWCYGAFGGPEGVFDMEVGAWSPELIDALFRNGDTLN